MTPLRINPTLLTWTLTVLALIIFSMANPSKAGEASAIQDSPGAVAVPDPGAAPSEEKLWKFTLDSRFRWEYGDQDGLDASNALTLRNRLGLLLGPIEGFRFFAEYEGTLAVDRDGYQAASVHGLRQNKTIIADPESHEVNQLWLSYQNWDTKVTVGRRRINLDNVRFIGNVGWRQNEQTFDAVTIENKSIENLTLFYGYINQVNRIFGSDSITNPAQKDFEGDSHLINVSYTVDPTLTLTGYLYFLDLHNRAGDTSSNHSVGLQAKGTIPARDYKVPYLIEAAYQRDGADSPLEYSAWYFHADAGLNRGKCTFGAGFEHLGAGEDAAFQTPLATLHAFNGWADIFLATPAGGLNDAYLFFNATLSEGLAFASKFHWFGPDSSEWNYGQEIDAALTYQINEHLSVGAKYAHYFADEFSFDTDRFILDFNIKY